MATRAGMWDLIDRLRRLVDDGTAGIWSSEELQDILDAHKFRVHREPLEAEKTLLSDTAYEYRVYHSRWGNLEAGGSATFKLEDSAGAQRGTATYTADYLRGVVTMTTDQVGTALYLTGWTYDLNGAAADCWRERATKVSGYYDVEMDGHRLSRSQWFKHCEEAARMFERKARPRTVRQWRTGLGEDY